MLGGAGIGQILQREGSRVSPQNEKLEINLPLCIKVEPWPKLPKIEISNFRGGAIQAVGQLWHKVED